MSSMTSLGTVRRGGKGEGCMTASQGGSGVRESGGEGDIWMILLKSPNLRPREKERRA